MRKRTISLLLALMMCLSLLPMTALAADGTAYASTQTILLNGEKVELQAYALKDANGYPTNYVKLRDVAYLLNGTSAQFEVTWDGAVNLMTGQSYTANGSEMKTPFSGDRVYTNSTAVTNVNGAEAALEAITLTDDNGGGYTYYKLRDLGIALGFAVDWTAETGITVDTPAAVADGEFDMEAFEQLYFTPPARLEEFAAFTGQVTEGTLTEQAENTWEKQGEGVTLRKLMVDGVPVYEAYVDDGKAKPMIFVGHGGLGGSKEGSVQMILQLAQEGLYAVAFDSAACGESDRGPLMGPVIFAETVKSIDTLLEYYNTVEQADPANTALLGSSLGGNIAYCYVAHGKYQLTAIFPSLGTPNLTLLGEKSLMDCLDHGKGQNQGTEPCWTEEQVMAFVEAYSPHQYPERFVDTYVYTGNGGKEAAVMLDAVKALGEEVAALGGTKFEGYIDPDRGHEYLPEYHEEMFLRIREVLLED